MSTFFLNNMYIFKEWKIISLKLFCNKIAHKIIIIYNLRLCYSIMWNFREVDFNTLFDLHRHDMMVISKTCSSLWI